MGRPGKYFIIDNVIIGNNHVINNSGIVNIIQHIDSENADITFFADESHIASVRNKVTLSPGKSVTYFPILIIDPARSLIQKGISWIKKVREDNAFIERLFKQARAEKPDFIFFCTLTAINLFLYMSRFRKNNDQKIIVELHGEIEFLFKKKRSSKDKFNALLYKKAFRNSPQNLKYLVLSSLIKDKIAESGLLSPDQILCIEHPISDIKPVSKTAVPAKPVLALLGVASLRKNAHQIFGLAKNFKQEIVDQKADFQIIGKVAPDAAPYVNEHVTLGSREGQPLDQKDYERLINTATYSLSFITGEEYTFRISGSLIDSIQYQIPIIALQHEYIAHIFREAGDIGFICETMDDMRLLIANIIRRDNTLMDRYAQQVRNLEHYSKRFSVSTNANLLKTQLSACSWAKND